MERLRGMTSRGAKVRKERDAGSKEGGGRSLRESRPRVEKCMN